MGKIVVITGGGAGVGRATASEFARNGCDVALLSRDPERLARAAAALRRYGVRALPIPTDVADYEAVEAATERVESELGPIDVWVNVAMATVFAPVDKLTAEEVARGTAVTYLGQVHGMMCALKHMRRRNRGPSSMWVQRSAIARCSCSQCIAGQSSRFGDSPNRFDMRSSMTSCISPCPWWTCQRSTHRSLTGALNKMGKRPQPVPPIFQPEIPARAIYFAAFHPRRQTWIGIPHCQGDPGQPYRAGPDRPLSRENGVFGTTDGRSDTR